MGGGTVFIVAFLCILQCGLYQAQNGNSRDSFVSMRIPYKALNYPLPSQKQYLPYPFYPLFSNSCNGCQSSICNRRSNTNTNNKPLNMKLPQSPFLISVLGANGQRTNIIIEGKPKRPKGKQTVDVIVKVKGNNGTVKGKPAVGTAAKSSATKNKDKEELTADTSADNVEVQVIVKDEGGNPEDTQLKSEIIDDNGQGDVSESKTKSEIQNKPKAKPAGKSKDADAPVDKGTPSNKDTPPSDKTSPPANPPPKKDSPPKSPSSDKPAPSNDDSPSKDTPPKNPPPTKPAEPDSSSSPADDSTPEEPAPTDSGSAPPDDSTPEKPVPTDSGAPDDEVEVPASPAADDPEKPADPASEAKPAPDPEGDKSDDDKDSDGAAAAADSSAAAAAGDGDAAAASDSGAAAAT